MREKISREREALHIIHEDQKEKRKESCLERNNLLTLEQEQHQTRQRLMEETKQLQKIKQDQECQRAELILTDVNLANFERQRAQEYQEQKSSEIENEQMREKISREREALHKIHEDQKEKRQESCLERNDLLMLERKQHNARQKLMEEEKHLQKIEQDQERQRAELISADVTLANLKRRRAQEYQELLQKSSEMTTLEQKFMNMQRKQKEQEQYLHSEAEGINELSHHLKLEIDREDFKTKLQRSSNQREFSQEQSERDMEERQRFEQDQLFDDEIVDLPMPNHEVERCATTPLRKTGLTAVQNQVTEASSSLMATDPNVLTRHNFTEIAKIKTFDGSRVVSGSHTNKFEAMNRPKVRHGFTEASLSSTVKDEVRLCESVLVAETRMVNNSKDTLQQCARHEVSISAFSAVIGDPEIARPRQVSETETLDNSEDISTQCALTSSMELTPPATRRKVREARSPRFATD